MLAQRVQAHLEGVVPADGVARPQLGLDDAEDRLDDRGLARARPAHDAHLRVPFHGEAEVVQGQRKSGLIPHRQVLKLQRILLGPRWDVLVLLSCSHLLSQSYLAVVLSPQLFLRLQSCNLV